MAEFASLEDFMGAPADSGRRGPPPPAAQKKPAAPSTISLEDFAGAKPARPAPSPAASTIWSIVEGIGQRLQTPLEGPAPEPPAPERPATLTMYGETKGGAVTGRTTRPLYQEEKRYPTPLSWTDLGARALGTAAQLSDLMTSTVKMVVGQAPYWAARTAVGYKTGDPEVAATAGTMAKDFFFPPEITTPWARVAETLGPAAKDAYYKNPVGWIIGKVSAGIEHAVEVGQKHGAQGGDLQAIAEQVMGSFAGKGMRNSWEKSRLERKRGRIDPPMPSGADRVRAGIVTPAPRTAVEQINAALNIKSPREQAKEARERRTQVRQAFEEPAEGTEYGNIAESQFRAEERLARQEAYAAEQRAQAEAVNRAHAGEIPQPVPDSRIPLSDLLRVWQKPGWERTADDLLVLREFEKQQAEARNAGAARVADRVAPRQEGGASPEMLARLGATAGGVALGAGLDSENPLRGAITGGLTFGAPALLMGGRVPRMGGEAGAVKPPGGMWHPEAVERLSEPLYNKLSSQSFYRRDLGKPLTELFRGEPEATVKADLQHDRTIDTWTRDRMSKYLNKYAGTERDPLKDIEIPFGEGTKRWEEITDRILGTRRLEDVPALWKDNPLQYRRMRSNPEEPVWGLPGGAQRAVNENALRSYLSHVGDYLRQNVDPAKLSQYDLVRAVKETAANDARVAKAAEKAAVASMKDLPVYREYPDGFKWVELKLPEELTPEQAKGVRPATAAEIRRGARERDVDVEEAGEKHYVAIDEKGKPIENTYTGETAMGPTPEDAFLAGQLAREGNQMGHCVGGYCEGVAAGASRIFSLRDPKGRSHVTAEVEPPPTIYDPNGKPTGAVAAGGENILQIKGKQNRAPNAEYLPYVQDFVKQGKWGEVGDLENTGLERTEEVRRSAEAELQLTQAQYFAGRLSGWTKSFDEPEGFTGYALERKHRQKHFQAELDRANAALARGETFTQSLTEPPPYEASSKGHIEVLEHSLKQRHPDVEVVLTEHPSSAIEIVDFARAKDAPPFPRIGQRALAYITEWADKHSRDLMLMAQPNRGSTMPLAKLVEIYERAGFKPGEEQPYSDAVMMYREPRRIADEKGTSPEGPAGTLRSPDQARPEGPEGQMGFADPKLLAGLGAIGLGGLAGAALDSENPLGGALLGALAGAALFTKGGRERIAEFGKTADRAVGILSTRVGNISEPAKLRLRNLEMRILENSHGYLLRTVPFMREISALKGERKAALERAILTNDGQAISEAIKGNPGMVAAWRETRNVLKELGEQLQGYGRFKSMLEDYFPRVVKDYEGLKAALDQPVRERLEQVLDDAEKKAIKARGNGLTEIERSAIINRELRADRTPRGHQPGYTKAREIDEITAKLQPFYYTPTESLFSFVRTAVEDLETARFFGRDLVQMEKGGAKYINLEQSIGNFLGRELEAGKITHEGMKEMEGLLRSRFEGGMRSPSRLQTEVRNIVNMGLLGNTISAATQLGDLAAPVYAQGLRATMTALAKKLSGQAKITAGDFGLADHLAEEFVGGKSAKALNTIFKWSGFKAVDMLGKDVMVGAALERMQSRATSKGGVAALRRKYGKAYGEEFDQLVSDLQQKNLTPNVRLAVFSELSDFQPISRSELPQAYLDHPNGRLLYTLKTFMLKQMDVMRRDVFQEMQQGPRGVARGLRNLTGYAFVLGIGGATADMVKDWMMGRDPHFAATDLAENVLKTFGWSEYVREKASHGEPLRAFAGSFMPPTQIVDRLLTRDPKIVQHIPLLGRFIYEHEMGGKEEWELREAKKAKKAGREFPLSPDAERLKERKREKRREAANG